MKTFNEYLHQFNEVGEVREMKQVVVEVAGLPRVRLGELVLIESGELGQVTGLAEETVEVLLLTAARLKMGTKVVRTGERLTFPVGDGLLNTLVTPLGLPIFSTDQFSQMLENRPIDISPWPLERRENVWTPLETGVAIVDMLVPLGKGQRELIIGDRKIGKTQFIQQAMVAHAHAGGVCVYGGIARRHSDLLEMRSYLTKQGIMNRVAMIVSLAADPAGMVFITPYAAMTAAEYFRDKNFDVLLVLDDLTIHAKYYREISLLAQRFPGRSAYPGDVFYAHARLMERAGKFDKGSITCLPIAETVLSDIRGYIQTNLMSMTDGHIFFDHELFNAGRRPAVNPFLSVTRVGHQTRSPVLKALSAHITGFLTHYERLRKLTHFGGELSGDAKQSLSMGDRLTAFFNQETHQVVPLTVNAIFLTTIITGMWEGVDTNIMKQQLKRVVAEYRQSQQLKTSLDSLLTSCQTFAQLAEAIKQYKTVFLGHN